MILRKFKPSHDTDRRNSRPEATKGPSRVFNKYEKGGKNANISVMMTTVRGGRKNEREIRREVDSEQIDTEEV
jgi:hypothetical protein